MDEATQQSQAEGIKTYQPHLELQILSPEKPELRLPFYAASMRLHEHAPGMLGESTEWLVEVEGDDVLLTHPKESSIPLQAGQSLRIEKADITLLDLRKPPAALLTAMDGLSWQLQLQRYQVGRRGRRLNHIELNEPTVSREQATLIPTQSDGFNLLAESGSSPTIVNETTLKPGEQTRLQHGDMVRFGNLLFRYTNHQEAGHGQLLGMRTLGTFEMLLDGQRVKQELTSAKTRWLMALLGTKWGQPISVEWVIGRFWPDATTSRARKNLGVALKQLRECLELSEEDFSELVIRTRTHLKLNPDLLGSHDFCDVRDLTGEGKPLTSTATLDRLESLYQGPFLGDCYEDWALQERQELEQGIVECLTRTVDHFGRRKELATARRALDDAVKLAPDNQGIVEIYMKAALEAASPEEAVAVYQELESRLKADDLEPDIELVKLFYRAQAGI